MSVERADTNGGSRRILRAVIMLAAIVIVVLTMAPMARAGEVAGVAEPTSTHQSTYQRSASDLPVSRPALGSVRPDHGCFTQYQQQNRAPNPDSVTAAGDSSPWMLAPAGADRPNAEAVGHGPCGKPNSFDPYGLGSLIWRGPDWGDPTLGHRT